MKYPSVEIRMYIKVVGGPSAGLTRLESFSQSGNLHYESWGDNIYP